MSVHKTAPHFRAKTTHPPKNSEKVRRKFKRGRAAAVRAVRLQGCFDCAKRRRLQPGARTAAGGNEAARYLKGGLGFFRVYAHNRTLSRARRAGGVVTACVHGIAPAKSISRRTSIEEARSAPAVSFKGNLHLTNFLPRSAAILYRIFCVGLRVRWCRMWHLSLRSCA